MMLKIKDDTYINSHHVVLMEWIDSQRLKIVLINGHALLVRDKDAYRVEQEICFAENSPALPPHLGQASGEPV